jgi:hypothetical protein
MARAARRAGGGAAGLSRRARGGARGRARRALGAEAAARGRKMRRHEAR